MDIGKIPEYLKTDMRKHFLSGLKGSDSVDMYEFELFRWFKKETEDAWARMDDQERQYIKDQVASGAEVINDSGIIATDYYRSRMRFSHVIFLTSLLEAAMKRECNRLNKAIGAQVLFKPSELKGSPWSMRRIFLERYGHFEVPSSMWEPIKHLLAVRNALAHHNGDVLLLTQEQISTLRKISGISLNSSEVGIEEEYVDQAIEAVREIVQFLHAKVNEVIDRAVNPKGVS